MRHTGIYNLLEFVLRMLLIIEHLRRQVNNLNHLLDLPFSLEFLTFNLDELFGIFRGVASQLIDIGLQDLLVNLTELHEAFQVAVEVQGALLDLLFALLVVKLHSVLLEHWFVEHPLLDV